MSPDKTSAAGPGSPAATRSDQESSAYRPEETAAPGASPPPPLSEMVRAVIADARALFQARLGLAKAELSSRARLVKSGAILLAAAAVLGLGLVTTALVGLMFIIAEWTGLALALLLVLLLFGGLIYLLAMGAVRAFKQAFGPMADIGDPI